MKKYISLILILLLAGCATVALNSEGSKVRVTKNSDVVRGCQYIGLVQGTDHMNGGLVGQGAAEQNAMNEIMNSAAAMNANTIHLVNISAGFSGSAIRGEAYRCSSL